MRIITSILLLFNILSATAQDLSLYEKKWLIRGADTLPYRILLPKAYDADKKYPLLIFLHGAGERGRDNELQLVHGAKLFLKDSIRDRYPAIIVFPQCRPESYWSNVTRKEVNGNRTFDFRSDGAPTTDLAMVMQLVKQLQNDHRISKDRIYIGGLSMGAMGTFEIVRRMPKTFAAAVAICGGGDPSTANKLKRTKWRVFHGAKDNVVPWQLSEQMVNALNRKNASVRFTLYPEATHNSWDPAFAEPDFFKWIFDQRK